MIARYQRLIEHPAVFGALTGLTRRQFDDLFADVAPRLVQLVQAEQARLNRPNRRRAIGGGRSAAGTRLPSARATRCC